MSAQAGRRFLLKRAAPPRTPLSFPTIRRYAVEVRSSGYVPLVMRHQAAIKRAGIERRVSQGPRGRTVWRGRAAGPNGI